MPFLLANALSVRGGLRLRLRRGAAARTDLDEATALYEQHSGREHFLTLQNQVLQGHAWVLDGTLDAGLAHARSAAEGISRKRAGEPKEAVVLTWLGRAELDAGQSRAAAATLQRAVGLWQALKMPARGAEAGLALVKAHAEHGDLDPARQVLAWVDGPATPPEGLNGQQQEERQEALAALHKAEA